MSRLFMNKSFHRNGKKANTAHNVSANNNTIYEEESPLQKRNRMNHTVCGAPIKSPHTKFYRNNSNPETILCAASVPETQKKVEDSRQQKSIGKFLRHILPNSRKKKNPSPDDSSFKHHEINESLLSDELDASSKTSPPQNVHDQIYEQSINKHGDVVEYAVPYSEQIMINGLQSPIKIIGDCGSTRCDDETYESDVDKTKWNDRLTDLNALGIVSPIKVTDLDKSSDGSRILDQSGDRGIVDRNNKDVLPDELDTLGRWSQNIAKSLPTKELPINRCGHVIECNPKEIKPRLSALRNTTAIPLHFSTGEFRENIVALRKCCPLDSVSVGLVEEAIERDYDILSKVKHSNIILLMAASFHRKSVEHLTLVLEPVDCTLNFMLHQTNVTFSIIESIAVVQQIASAALYLHKCGYIHSNICSHNILVRKSPWCVKLSSFELTTEVDFADTRIEILIKYRQKLPLVGLSNCVDIPNYATAEEQNVSLRDQYKQKSKLLPILQCSTSSQHSFLSMMSKHLIYDTNYRQHLSLHNFQAPELLTTKRQFVFPTTKSDVYSLCLLLWEMLNDCVPFVVYSKVDMERMIGQNKLSLPFFERERCQPFMDIFRVGLAVNPDNRVFDVKQLITMLEDCKFLIRSGDQDLHEEQHMQRSDVDRVNLYVNTDDRQKNQSVTESSIFSPDSTDFNHCDHDNQLTSTKKKRRKSPRKFVKKNTFRQLFNNTKEMVNISENESVLTHAQLNNNLDAIASEIQREQSLDEIQEESESIYDSSKGSLLDKNAKLPSTDLVEKSTDRDSSSRRNAEWRKTSPEIVDYEVSDENHSINSKSCSNLFDGSTSESRQKSFHSNIVSPPCNGFDVGSYSLPDTPIARKNKIRRNTWLSNKSLNLSNKEIDELAVAEQKDQSLRLNESNQLNVSIRIVHNKVTPKKVDSGNPSVMSRIKFFDSTTGDFQQPTSTNKIANNDRVEDIDMNYSANYPIKNSTSKQIIESSSDDCNSHRTLSNCSTLPMSRKRNANARSSQSKLDQPNDSFENKFWKREMDICNRSLGSSGTDEDANIITPKWQSVRDKILKFEKRGILNAIPSSSSSFTTATEFVKSLSKSVTGAQSNSTKYTEAPTLIKRTIYRESIVSGVDLSAFDSQMPLFDQLNLAGQKLTTQVTLNMRQIRRRSSDLDEIDRRKLDATTTTTTEIRHTVCGSQKGLLSFNTGTVKDGLATGGKTKYICTNCTSKMSPDELRALTFDSVPASSLNTTSVTDPALPSPMKDGQRTPQMRCQVRVKAQNTRSIEDLYIDDDFDQGFGLGANIELLSDCSDFLNFDIFNKSSCSSSVEA